VTVEPQGFQQKNTEAAIMARLIQSRLEMDANVARYLLSFDFEPDDVERMNVLAERARAGSISPDEAAEMDSYLHVGNLLAIMQSKARIYLRQQNGSSSRQ
jgi:hypothetical protein